MNTNITVGELFLFSKIKYGVNSKNVPIYEFHPLSPSLPFTKVASTYGKKHGTQENIYVVVEYDASYEKANILEILGPISSPVAGFMAIQIRHLGYTGQLRSRKNERRVLVDTPVTVNPTEEDLIEENKDICILATIDPPGCQDIDDAISFSSVHDTIGVHIADVSSIVKSNSEIDKWFKLQPLTLYRPDGEVFHSLPRTLSTETCSLRPNEIRNVISVFFTIEKNENGDIINVSTKLKESKIRSKAQLTYDDADQLLRSHNDWKSFATTVEQWNNWLQSTKAKEVCESRGHAEDRIAIQLALQESREEDNVAKKVSHGGGQCISDSHNMIAFLMIQANAYVANILTQYAKDTNQYTLLRSHQHNVQSDSASSTRQIQWASACAEYVCTQQLVKHCALNLSCYTHFTSPIRRYADVQVHRMLKCYLHSVVSDEMCKENITLLADNLNHYMQKHHRVEIEWDWWWNVACKYKKESIHEKKQVAATVIHWSVCETFGVSILLWFEDMQRNVWVRAIHPKLMKDIQIRNNDVSLELISNEMNMHTTFKRGDSVCVKWWWNIEKGIRGLKFIWIHPVLLTEMY